MIPELSTPNKFHFQSKNIEIPKYSLMCIDLIEKSSYHPELTAKHSAIIVNSGRIIGQGINVHKTHPMAIKPILWFKSSRMLETSWTIHAEMNAIRSVKNKDLLRGATMYVARLSKRYGLRMSCPCESCQYYIRMYGIKKIVYTTDNGNWMYQRISK